MVSYIRIIPPLRPDQPSFVYPLVVTSHLYPPDSNSIIAARTPSLPIQPSTTRTSAPDSALLSEIESLLLRTTRQERFQEHPRHRHNHPKRVGTVASDVAGGIGGKSLEARSISQRLDFALFDLFRASRLSCCWILRRPAGMLAAEHLSGWVKLSWRPNFHSAEK